MTTFVTLTHERTGETRSIKEGWSWTIFLFSTFWGLPLFYRRLFDCGMIMFILSMMFHVFTYDAVTGEDLLLAMVLLGPPSLALAVYLGLNGNELTAKQLLREGWTFADPTSKISQNARQAWSLAPRPAHLPQAGDS